MTEESFQPAAAPAPETPAATARTPAWLNPWLLVGIVVVALFAWQWFETRLRLAETQQELARRLAESDGVAKESRLLAKQAQDQLMALQAKFGAVEARLAESQSQQAALETLYQDLARNRDEWALAEVEQGVTLAAQQLQLAGNVQGAVLALQAADARLAGSSRPQFIGLRKAFARDLDRLKALPQVDLPGMSVRLESVVTAIDALPLAVDVRPREETRPKPELAADTPAWQRLLLDTWHEMKGLVRIQRFDRDEPVLLAPGQVFFLRENLKLRLLNARLAMLSRDQWTFRNELKAAQSLLERHFDGRDKSVQTALGALRQLGAAEVSIELPTLNESLSAIRGFKANREREARDGRK
ncbi:uroporphyrinogen-III C-methyltransferase [Azospira restricta]|uniref:Uroporphyrinogen-III C-methyltransferase n=1 Tax=Azospira restricta TaxID=404405 RepID=A0A974SRD7_9RHOO|nr:uroporphyrinogen-III C-methyltransferase [Azospira restricta]QRJ65051.1 uroporphyrinogen-III C-methyltransferase [Azospira restricta]